MQITKNNIVIMVITVTLYILVDFVVFMNDMFYFWMIALIQLGITILAVSPIGECILRFFYGGHELTKKESERLSPVFQELKNKANLEDVELYIDNDITINAYALGTRTIVINRGCLETLTDDQIRGILAHEFGHLSHGDNLVQFVLLVGNLMFLGLFMALRLIGWIIRLASVFSSNRNEIHFIGRTISLIDMIGYSLTMFIIQLLLLINQRKCEYQADQYACQLGYGQNMLDVLYILSSLDVTEKMSILERLKASHPYIRDRIKILESENDSVGILA